MEYNQCYFKKFHRDEFYIMKSSDIIKDVLSDGDMVEIVVRKTASKRKETRSSSESNETECVIAEDEELPEPASFVDNDTSIIDVNGYDLTLDSLIRLGKGEAQLSLSEETVRKLHETRSIVENIVEKGYVRYGINTGFGLLSKVVVESEKLVELQYNIVRSHCAGIGEPLAVDTTRRILALRINVLAKAFSGCNPGLVEYMVEMFNKSCLPLIPAQGTVGASGDLAPLAHLAQGMIGEGKMWSPKTGLGDALEVLAANDMVPYQLTPKDGLSLINGTQFICGVGAEALQRAKQCLRTTIVINAIVLDILEGHTSAYDERVHAIRPHAGQQRVAAALRALCNNTKYPSEIYQQEKHDVQDPYTIRCVPQVVGITLDTLNFVEGIFTTEMNSATDNPLVFGAGEGQDIEHADIISAGNFHGEYPAKALDFLTIAVHEIGNMSERRLERLCNPTCSNLPAFLVDSPGLNSGFMIPHCTSAALVSENKTLCFPSSADTQSTSAGKEDHVSMGGWSARKALTVVKNLENVLAIELIAACQALEFKRPLRTTEPLEAVYCLVRSKVEPYVKDRAFTPDIEVVQEMIEKNLIWDTVAQYLESDPLWDEF
ncbi:probable histidine ammonia-lyase isoform X2 [Bolinopsis microptera]